MSTTNDRRFTDVRHRMAEWLRANRHAAPADVVEQPPQAPSSPAPLTLRDAYHSGFRAGRDIARDRCGAQVAALQRQLRNAHETIRRLQGRSSRNAPPGQEERIP